MLVLIFPHDCLVLAKVEAQGPWERADIGPELLCCLFRVILQAASFLHFHRRPRVNSFFHLHRCDEGL